MAFGYEDHVCMYLVIHNSLSYSKTRVKYIRTYHLERLETKAKMEFHHQNHYNSHNRKIELCNSVQNREITTGLGNVNRILLEMLHITLSPFSPFLAGGMLFEEFLLCFL